jgi:hypothetical protein
MSFGHGLHDDSAGDDTRHRYLCYAQIIQISSYLFIYVQIEKATGQFQGGNSTNKTQLQEQSTSKIRNTVVYNNNDNKQLFLFERQMTAVLK